MHGLHASLRRASRAARLAGRRAHAAHGERRSGRRAPARRDRARAAVAAALPRGTVVLPRWQPRPARRADARGGLGGRRPAAGARADPRLVRARRGRHRGPALVSGPGVFAATSRSRIHGDAWRLSVVGTALVGALLLALYRSARVLGLGLLPVASGALAAWRPSASHSARCWHYRRVRRHADRRGGGLRDLPVRAKRARRSGEHHLPAHLAHPAPGHADFGNRVRRDAFFRLRRPRAAWAFPPSPGCSPRRR